MALSILMLTGLVACAGIESQTKPPMVEKQLDSKDGLDSANVVYNSHDYAAAIDAFKAISLDSKASASSRRMSYLGQALIYLGSDKKLHSLENAKLALRSASQVTPAENEEFSLSTDMLMDAITITIGSESRYTELRSKSGNSNSEVARLKSERDALLADNSKLLEEQAALNEALERLKNLTLGN